MKDGKSIILCEPGGAVNLARLLGFLEVQRAVYGAEAVEGLDVEASRERGFMYFVLDGLEITVAVREKKKKPSGVGASESKEKGID